MAQQAERAEEYARGMLTGGTLFEELGFYYVGPIDGHSLDHLLPVLKNVRDARNGPILVHVVTQKGKGYAPAEASADKYHGVVPFNVATGSQVKAKTNAPSYTKVFGESLVKEAAKDERIVAITAAMPSGTGVDIFGKAFPDRTFDVGIAEQHAVTFAAGLAAEGRKPFAAIYSTFLQRAYDQVVHDVAIQNLPVRFAIDRAGLVGADGPTHAGSFDIAYLGCLPEHGDHGGRRRGGARAYGGDRGGDRRPSERFALSARRRAWRRDAVAKASRWRSAAAGFCAKATRSRCCRSVRGSANASRPPTISRRTASRPPSPMRASPSRSTPISCCAWRANTNCWSPIEEGSIGGFGSYVLHALAERDMLGNGLKVRTHGAARHVHGPGQARPDVCQGRPRCGGHHRAGDAGARQADCARERRQGGLTMKDDTKKPMKVILAQPRGFCAGVVRAVEIVERALEKYGPPVYVRHEIVHNKHVVEGLKAKGARFVENLSEIPADAVTIFSAHGVAQKRRRRGGRAQACRCSTRPVRW